MPEAIDRANQGAENILAHGGEPRLSLERSPEDAGRISVHLLKKGLMDLNEPVARTIGSW